MSEKLLPGQYELRVSVAVEFELLLLEDEVEVVEAVVLFPPAKSTD